jgi:histidyl-tRNA synthetase
MRGARSSSVSSVSEKEKIQSVKGMRDILPQDSWLWERVEGAYRRVMALYNYLEIGVPVLEKTVLFARSIGEDTDIVGKEMYTFTDTGGDELSLRPEGTAGVVRAYVQHAIGTQEPVSKLYYIGPMFRRERPQKGRFRQFHQAGSEMFGVPGPFPEIEQILMLKDFFGNLGLGDVAFACNHLGTPESRAAYSRLLVAYFQKRSDGLCEDCRRRLETNPLRILDCKQAACGEIIAGSPSFEASRPESAARELETFIRVLRGMAVAVDVEPRLVRGLDYYTGIVFEGVARGEGDEGKGLALGGRYDELVSQLGGPPTPAVGYAIGLERLVDVCRSRLGEPARPDVFVVVIGAQLEPRAVELMHRLRGSGWRCEFDPRGGSLKSQMKRADRVAARVALILGEDELRAGNIRLRCMAGGEQLDVPEAGLDRALREKLGAPGMEAGHRDG